ncbi:MAG: FecR family protein [Caulobacter sp.]|nr:FecR family protein [Caulobacter sp.]
MKSLPTILACAVGAAMALLALAGCEQKADKPAAPPAAATTEAVGLNAEIDNDVRQKSVTDPGFRGAVLQGPVRYADDILTAIDSRLLVRLKDDSGLTVGPNARISIDKFVIDTDASAPGAAVSVAKGAFRFASSGKGSKPDGVRFNTPLAAIGIRGTVLEGVVGPDALNVIGSGPWLAILSLDPETATVIVLREGIIEVRFGDETIVLDEPGEAIVLGGSRRSTVFQIPAPATGRLDALLAPRGVGPRPLPTNDPPQTADAGDKSPPPAPDKPRPPRRRDPARGPSDEDYSHDNEAVGGSDRGGGLSRPELRRGDGSVVEPKAPAPRWRNYGEPAPHRDYGAPLPRRDAGPGAPQVSIPVPSYPPRQPRDRQPQPKAQAPARDPAPSPQLKQPAQIRPSTAKDQPPPAPQKPPG